MPDPLVFQRRRAIRPRCQLQASQRHDYRVTTQRDAKDQ